jgi:hypothetical protein
MLKDKDVRWKDASLVKGDLGEKITELKRQSGKDIGVAGSPRSSSACCKTSSSMSSSSPSILSSRVVESALQGRSRPEETETRRFEDDRHGCLDPRLPAGRKGRVRLVRRRAISRPRTEARGSKQAGRLICVLHKQLLRTR